MTTTDETETAFDVQADDDPDGLVCEQCNSTFEHSGRGRRPKRCPSCRATSPRRRSRTTTADTAETDQAPKRPKPLESLKRNIHGQLAMLGTAVMLVDQFDAAVILRNAEKGAEVLANLAATNPAIRRGLERGVEMAGWGPVLMWGVTTALPILAHHGLIPGQPDPAQTGPTSPRPSGIPFQHNGTHGGTV